MTEGRSPEPSANPAPRPVNKRRRRWLAWSVLVLFLLPVVILAGFYFALRSPLMESQVWPRLQPMIAEQAGFEVEVESLRVDLLRSIRMEGLRVQQIPGNDASGDACDDLHLTMDSFGMDFRPMALLQNELQVDRIAVRGLDVSGCTVLDAEETDEEEPAPFDPEALMDELLAMLDEPPMAIHMHQVILEGLRADVEIRIPSDHMHLTWNGEWDLQSSFHWQDDHLSGEVRIRLASLAPVHVNQQGPDGRLELRLTPQLDADLDWSVRRNGVWQLKLASRQMQFRLDDFSVALDEPGMQLAMDWPAYRLEMGENSTLQLTVEDDWPLQVDMLVSSHLPQADIELEDAEAGRLRTSLDHRLDLEASGDVHLLVPTLERLFLESSSEQGFSNLTFRPVGEAGAAEQINLADARLKMQAGNSGEALDALRSGDFVLAMDGKVEDLDSPFFVPVVTLHPQAELTLKQDLSQADVSGRILLDELEWMTFAMPVYNKPERLELHPRLLARIPQSLGATLPDAEDLYTLGDLELTVEGQADWHHGQPDLVEADLNQLDTWHLAAQLQMGMTQTRAPRDPGGLVLPSPLLARMEMDARHPAETHRIDMHMQSEAIQYPPLLQPVPMTVDWQARLDGDGVPVWQQGEISLNQEDFLSWKGDLDDQPQQAAFIGDMRFRADPAWKEFMADLDDLALFGEMDVNGSVVVRIRHPYDSVMEIAPEQLDTLHVQMEMDGRLVQGRITPESMAELPEPLHFVQTLDWTPQAMTSRGTSQLATLRMPADDLEVNGLEMQWQADFDDGFDPSSMELTVAWFHQHMRMPDMTMEGYQSDMQMSVQLSDPLSMQMQATADAERLEMLIPPADPDAEDAQPGSMLVTGMVFPMTMDLQGSLDEAGDELTMHHMELSLVDGWLKQTMSGIMGPATDTASYSGVLRAEPRDGLVDGLEAGGQVEVPWQLNMAGDQISFSAIARFTDLSLSMPEAGVYGMDGRINITQELEFRDDDRMAFSYLVAPDAFQRVDFNRVEPYLDDRQDFRIREIRMEDVRVGPLHATLPIRQNQMRLQQFRLQLLDGNMAGQFYLDMTPGAWRIGLLSRVTGVDVRPLLPERLAATDYAPISARTAVEFDLTRRLLEGRIDMTEITRSQLLQLMDLVDPDQLDPELSNARSALRAAHPRWVSVEMQQGLMNLSMGLSLFTKPIHVRGLPLSSMIERFGEEALALPDTLPLE